jgi:hypothetical protein
MPKFIIHLCAIYIDSGITVYLISVDLGGLDEDTRVCARVNQILLGCQNSFTKNASNVF